MKREYLILAIIISLLITVSGCLDFSTSKQYIHDVNVTVSLNYTEIASINYTKIKEDVESHGYKVTVIKSSDVNYSIYGYSDDEFDYYYGYYDYILCLEYLSNSYNVSIDITASLHNDVYTAKCFSLCIPLTKSSQDPDNIEAAKEYTKDKANEIAQICNLTMNWDNAKWTVNYVD